MKYFLLVVFTIMVAPVGAVERSDGFWDKCPGPACPANSPEKGGATHETYNLRNERELIKRERELLDKEKQLNEREDRLQERSR